MIHRLGHPVRWGFGVGFALRSAFVLLESLCPAWTVPLRSALSRFITGLIFRNPERVREARKFLEDFWLHDYDNRVEEYNRAKSLATLITSTTSHHPRNGLVCGLQWTKSTTPPSEAVIAATDIDQQRAEGRQEGNDGKDGPGCHHWPLARDMNQVINPATPISIAKA
jgi:hypothetical protein